jgi:murein DD-endopeptidase MepM/ murein hydrolase activator NlpD
VSSAVEHREVVVVGGGQAGLAIGYFLAQQGRRFVILEAADEPGAAWRSRWNSMRLFTPVRFDGLPGLAFPGEADSYPGRDDVVAYLTEYARRFELPVELNSHVQSVRARDGGGFLVGVSGGTYEADQVVVATGPFQVPVTPAIAAGLSGDVVQMHSSRYRAPADLPPGTVLLVSFAGLPAHPAATQTNRKRSDAAKRRHHRRKRYAGRPLRVTPPLGLHEYVFPVVGQSDYVDTYGALRTDVPGHWHHGDDIFASLGTPVVAVASGTLNRVGWEKIGGWRLWVRDSLGNEFYYAHLSGYSPLALHSTRVRAGDVIGFVGNTGDAFTTSPHVHFEIHPRSLLSLDYDGAVDPTSYLDHWRHLPRVGPPRPTHPPFPSGAVRNEAKFVWRELLAARGLIKHPPKRSEPPPPSVPRFGGISVAPVEHAVAAGPAAAAVDARRGGHSLPTLVLVLLGVIASAGAGSVVLLFRQRRHAHEAAEPTAEAESA